VISVSLGLIVAVVVTGVIVAMRRGELVGGRSSPVVWLMPPQVMASSRHR
jgi:hypothetical protein